MVSQGNLYIGTGGITTDSNNQGRLVFAGSSSQTVSSFIGSTGLRLKEIEISQSDGIVFGGDVYVTTLKTNTGAGTLNISGVGSIDTQNLDIDIDTIISSLKKTNRIVSLEEGWPVAGIGAEISAIVMEKGFDYLDAPLVRVCGADVPMPYAQNLEAEYLPDVKQLVNAINSVCYR